MSGLDSHHTRPWPLQRVYQLHEDGCGMACVAMLAGITYGEARCTIFGETEVDATTLDDMRRALSDHGLHVPRRMTPFWHGLYTELRQHALLAINPAASGMWHWAVWDARRRRILDPLRRPSRKPVVVGYLPVTPRARRRSNLLPEVGSPGSSLSQASS